MNKVHPAAWIGLVINLGLMIYGISQVTDSYYLDTVDTVFLLLFVGGGLCRGSACLCWPLAASQAGLWGLSAQ